MLWFTSLKMAGIKYIRDSFNEGLEGTEVPRKETKQALGLKNTNSFNSKLAPPR